MTRSSKKLSKSLIQENRKMKNPGNKGILMAQGF